MTNFDYNTDIPDTPNDPSVDQPKMKTNTNSIGLLINEDHIGFKQNNGGFHRQSRYVSGALPINLIASSSTVYSKDVTDPQLFFTQGTTGKEYQLTRGINADFATFSTDTNYPQVPAVVTQFGGWTFLPGGMLLQYGLATVAAQGTPTTIKYPVSFTGIPFSITIGNITAEGNSPGSNNQYIKDGTVTATQFQIVNSSSSSARKVYWQAIGV